MGDMAMTERWCCSRTSTPSTAAVRWRWRWRWTLTGSGASAEELTQDAFVEVFRRWTTVSAVDSPGGYVRRVVRRGRSADGGGSDVRRTCLPSSPAERPMRLPSPHRRTTSSGQPCVRSHHVRPRSSRCSTSRTIDHFPGQLRAAFILDGLVAYAADASFNQQPDPSVPLLERHMNRYAKVYERAVGGLVGLIVNDVPTYPGDGATTEPAPTIDENAATWVKEPTVPRGSLQWRQGDVSVVAYGTWVTEEDLVALAADADVTARRVTVGRDEWTWRLGLLDGDGMSLVMFWIEDDSLFLAASNLDERETEAVVSSLGPVDTATWDFMLTRTVNTRAVKASTAPNPTDDSVLATEP